MRKNSGFTAFELVISMAIMVVIAALVLPPYLKWQRDHRLKGAVNNLLGDLEMAKIRAIRENTFVAISFDAESYTIFLDNGQPGGTPGNFQADGEFVIKTKELPAGIEIDTASLTFDNDFDLEHVTRFNGRGLPDLVTAENSITLKNRSDSRSITINRLGFLKLQ